MAVNGLRDDIYLSALNGAIKDNEIQSNRFNSKLDELYRIMNIVKTEFFRNQKQTCKQYYYSPKEIHIEYKLEIQF